MHVPPKSERNVIPRWRSYEETVLIGELDPPQRSTLPTWKSRRRGLDRREADWLDGGGLAFASDLIGSAVVLGPTPGSIAAAEEVLKEGTDYPLLTAAARRLIDRAEGEAERDRISPMATAVEDQIRHFRTSTRRNQMNAIRWSELARYHTIAGHLQKAERAMRVARALAPSDRYVLRSAARFEIHSGNPDRAAALLTEAATQSEDPWLVAAALGASGVARTGSNLIRTGQQLLASGRHDALELGELASALGTIEAHEGNDRQARRFFRQALEDPTDNAVAQAEWASRHVAGVPVPDAAHNQPESWEARAWVAAGEKDHRKALDEAWRWHFDQPFASRPAEFGSYHASIEGDYEAGVEIARAALRSNQDEFMLLNNLAFCLASADRPAEAHEVYSRVRPYSLSDRQRPIYLATRGLIAFRIGLVDEGRHLYAESINSWGDQVNRGIALVMLAREERRIRAPHASAVEARARNVGRLSSHGDLDDWLRHLDASRVVKPR